MPLVRARHAGRTASARVPAGTSLRDGLETAGMRARTGCNGNGSCGLCRVRVLDGEVSAPTVEEALQLGPPLLAAGVRLACQAEALGDVELEVTSLAPAATWRGLPPETLPAAPATGGRAPGPAAGIALDVGTTNLSVALWSRDPARRLAALRGPNPQAHFGADVVTRLQAARDPTAAAQLAQAVVQAIGEGLRDAAAADGFELAPDLAIMAVGNTAMLALLAGSHAALLDPQTWGDAAAAPARPLRWQLDGQHAATVDLVPALGGFVGSDLLAAVLGAGLLDREAPALLLDFGTNTEIALWDGRTLWVTSAAGGPAFEGSGMSCAVPADPGAIFRVRPAGATLSFDVIDGAPPMGVCGSGLVDWLACLVRDGSVSARGALPGGRVLSLGGDAGGIVLAKRDVDVFQRAKAAIGAGVRLLADRAGLSCAALRRVVTTGMFGRSLDAVNAQAIGLLPAVPPERVATHDNLALAGCELLLRSPDGARALDAVRARARQLNLAQCADFEELFMEELFLAPLGSTR
ncbi:MAG TPA: ASKHA domain-containing protein [Polyangia bacterium]|jgi:uncharacterized 2Fe-2S/4Fe-4S cluster protein (DUF4445 family)